MSRFYLGLDTSITRDLPHSLNEAVNLKFDFITAPLMHPRYRRDAVGTSSTRDGPGTRSDLIMDGHTWSTCIMGKLSTWLSLDSPHSDVRKASEEAFVEVSWCLYYTHSQTFIFHLIDGNDNVSLYLCARLSTCGLCVHTNMCILY